MYKQLITALGLTLVTTAAVARSGTWEVTITNTTPAQSFTPILVVAHDKSYSMFKLGRPANEALEAMAEGGDTGLIASNASSFASDMGSTEGLLGPGQSQTVTVEGDVGRSRLSLAGMLLPTNDNFVAVNSMSFPRFGSKTEMVPAYDAGTEMNDQSCQHIPGPRCGGEGMSSEEGEGYVLIGNGFHDRGDEDPEGFEILSPLTYDWRNPVAMIKVKRVK